MVQIAIPYYSGNGHTRKLAQHVAAGCQTLDTVTVELVNVADLEMIPWDKLHNADAIIFGSPTYFGGVAGPFKVFLDKCSDFWTEETWGDKIAGGFTVGTSPSGDKLGSLQQLSLFAMQFGMIWVGQNHIGSKYTEDGLDLNEPGAWLGLMAKSDLDKTTLISAPDARTARLFGARIAASAQRWQEGNKSC